MKSALFVTLLVLVSVKSSAQIVLKGKAPDFANKTISVFEYEDFFTRTRVERANQILNGAGEFSLSYSSVKPLYIEVFLNDTYSGIYIQQGFTYELVFDKKGRLHSVISEDENNEIIKTFDEKNHALYKYQNKGVYLTKIKEFIEEQKNEILNLEPFIRNILTYKLARRELYTYNEENDSVSVNLLEKNLFLGRSIDNSIPDYFSLLKTYYPGRFNMFSFRRTPFNNKNILSSFLNETTFIPNDSIQQLAFLSILEEAYLAEWGGPKDRVNQLTDSIFLVATNDQVKRAAAFLKRKSNTLNQGDLIRDFPFTTNAGETMSLSSFKGKYVIIDFWFIGCSSCIENFPNLMQLKQVKNDNLEIVSLTPYDTAERITAFLRKHSQYNWRFAPVNKDGDLLNYFNVSWFPAYFLIDPQGKLVKRFNHDDLAGGYKEIARYIK